jgi:hypothetical protein
MHRGCVSQQVAEAGNQPDDSVQAEADAGAGDDEGLIQQNLQSQQRPVAEEPRAAVPAIRRLNGLNQFFFQP